MSSHVKGELVTVTIDDIGNDGEGIGKADGYTLFIKDAVIGDTVTAKIIKAKKSYGYARLMEVIKPSPDRVTARCPVARQCGGCQIQEMSYEKQLEYKRNVVANNLLRIGGFKDVNVLPPIGMDDPFNYRNKAQYPVGRDKDGNVVMGFYAGRTHHIIDNTDCCIGALENAVILDTVRDYIHESGAGVYDENTGSGAIRHILIRKGFHTGEIMVCVVINAKSLPCEDMLVEKLRGIEFGKAANAGESSRLNKSDMEDVKKVEGYNCGKSASCESELNEGASRESELNEGMPKARISSIVLNINMKNTNVILGDTCRTLWGEDCIHDSIGGITFQISPLSFYQVNPVQTEKLYAKAVEYAGLTGVENVWDMYCGIGTISLLMAGSARFVTGVEIVPQAIENAKENAKLNGITNAQFYVGKAEEIAPELVAEGNIPDVIVVDPPRKGCDESLLNTIISVNPKRVVYVSCDPATLARDLKYLCTNGYTLDAVQPVDQFCHSIHTETCALLTKPSASAG